MGHLFVCVTELCGQSRKHASLHNPLLGQPGWHRCKTCQRSDSLMFIGYVHGVGGDDMDYGPAPGLHASTPPALTFPIRIQLPPPRRPMLALPAPPPVIPKAPPLPAARASVSTWQVPRFPFEAAFGKQVLLSVRETLAERAPILLSSPANVCATLARLAPRPARMCELVGYLVTARMWELSVDKLSLLDTTKELLGFLLADNPPDDPEEWVSMLGWLIAGTDGVRLNRKEATTMLRRWRGELPIGTDSRTLLVLLQRLGEHLQPSLLQTLTRAHADAMGVATLRTLCNVAWAPPIALAPGVAAPVAPGFAATFWAAIQALAQVPGPGLTQDAVTQAQVDQTTELVTRMCAAGMTWLQCFQLLELLPRTTTVNRLKRARSFIKEAALLCHGFWTWARTLEQLAKFIVAGRVGYVTANNVQIEGDVEHQVDFAWGTDTIQLIASRPRVTYFAEAHSYASLEFSDAAIQRAPQITLWAHGFQRAHISATVAQLLALPATKALATRDWARRNENPRPYMASNIQVEDSVFEVGLAIRGYTQRPDGSRVWRVHLTHFAPSGTNSLPTALLHALRQLLT